MGQTITFEADSDSPLTETQARRIAAILEELAKHQDAFETLRITVKSDTALDLAFPPAEKIREGLDEGVDQEDADTQAEEPKEAKEEVDEIDEGLSIEQERDLHRESDELPTVNPGTRRYTLSSVLYHSDGYLTTAELVDHSEGTEWELGQSPASAELYNMYGDFVVHRRERGGDGPYEYWLTDDGLAALEAVEEPIEPHPFEE